MGETFLHAELVTAVLKYGGWCVHTERTLHGSLVTLLLSLVINGYNHKWPPSTIVCTESILICHIRINILILIRKTACLLTFIGVYISNTRKQGNKRYAGSIIDLKYWNSLYIWTSTFQCIVQLFSITKCWGVGVIISRTQKSGYRQSNNLADQKLNESFLLDDKKKSFSLGACQSLVNLALW